MRSIIYNLLNLSAQNISVEVIWALGVVYVVVLLVSLASIWSLSISFFRRLAWSLLSIGMPVLGISLYCMRCIAMADYSSLAIFHSLKQRNT